MVKFQDQPLSHLITFGGKVLKLEIVWLHRVDRGFERSYVQSFTQPGKLFEMIT